MMLRDPRMQILVGLVLVVVGFVLPVLMVMDIVTTTFFWSLVAHGASVVGLILGLVGTMTIARFGKD